MSNFINAIKEKRAHQTIMYGVHESFPDIETAVNRTWELLKMGYRPEYRYEKQGSLCIVYGRCFDAARELFSLRAFGVGGTVAPVRKTVNGHGRTYVFPDGSRVFCRNGGSFMRFHTPAPGYVFAEGYLNLTSGRFDPAKI